MSSLTCKLRVLECDVLVNCDDEDSSHLLREAYSAFLSINDISLTNEPVLRVNVEKLGVGWLLRTRGESTECESVADLLYYFEKSLELWVQECRADLFFTHAAAMSRNDRCVVVSGESGSGKSTLAWYLSNAGFDYLSDELAPICPELLRVEPYPHALCLKTKPPGGPPLPKSTIQASVTMHVPAYELSCHPVGHACPIAALVFLDSSRNGQTLAVSHIGSAEAAARLYSNGLNQLAHANYGLKAATAIAGGTQPVLISGGTVEDRASAIRDVM